MNPVLRYAELEAEFSQLAADRLWWDYVRLAVAGGVRCDVSMESLRDLPWTVEVAPCVRVKREAKR